MTRWSSHSEAMLQASLDDVDWDMFRASSSDVSEFTDVAVSFINTLTNQATETVTIRTFSNQKPWVDRSIRDAVNHRTAAYNAGLLSGNMSEYKTSCYALRRAVRAAKLRYRERIESHFQLNDSRRMWQGLKTICSSGNNSSAEVRACVMFHCLCYFYFIFYFIIITIFLHFPLSGPPVLTYISLLIIPCMIVYVTNNKEPRTLK